MHSSIKPIHDETIDWLVKRLEFSGRYSSIEKNVEYARGEFDVLTHIKGTNIYHYYEVKSTYRQSTYNKAKKQIKRAKSYFNHWNLKGIYVTPKKIIRVI